jgi:hemolysin D
MSEGRGVATEGKAASAKDAKGPSLQDLEFLPDPDAIEQRPLGGLTRLMLVLLSAILFGAVTWASVSHIDEIITASGKLVSAVPNLTVQPLETAIVQSIAVKPGQVVKKGQLLASLDPTFAGADQAQVKGLLQQLNERAERITRELRILDGKEPASAATLGSANASLQSGVVGPDSKGRALQGELQAARIANYESRTRALDSAIDRLQASLKTNRQDQGMLAQRLKSVAEVEHMQERLMNQNFGAKRQLLEARERRQEIERELLLTKNREQEILKEIATQEADLQAFRNEWRQRLLEEQAEVTKERNNLITQVEKADKRKSLIDLVAPADAVVLEIPQRSVGSVVTAAEVMFSLVPLDSPLQAELKIAARDVGFVKPGDPVKVKLDAFPFQKYGTLKGQITTVSEDAFTKDTDMQTARLGSYYLARVKLESLQLQRKADEVLIRPGSSLIGEIRIGERTVMSYFVYPLIGTLDQSLRER